jgi:ATP:ADP antiporter, AAA family
LRVFVFIDILFHFEKIIAKFGVGESMHSHPHTKEVVHSNEYRNLKVILISLAYFFVIGGNTLFKDLRDSIFMAVVGRDCIPYIKLLSMFVLLPAILFHSLLVDRIRRYQLLYYYAIFYGCVSMVFTYFIGHPTIGIANTDANPNRIFGWLFYLFVEGYTPFIVSVFWAFANSVYSPEEAKNNYAYMISVSKLGGMTAAGFAWYLLSKEMATGSYGSHVLNHQMLLGGASLMIIAIPLVIRVLMKMVPGKFLHGYEAVYRLEKERKDEKTGIFSGLELLLRWPYIFGIFGMVFFYEISHSIFSYLRLVFVEKSASNISEVSAELFKQAFSMHLIGLFISFVGTRILLTRLGERYCLLLIPITVVGLLCFFLTSHSPSAILITFILLRSLNYAFFKPVIESLYIPTLKDVKFKSKSWIDAFGTKLAKASGSGFNLMVAFSSPDMFFPLHLGFFVFIASLWLVTAHILGKRFNKAVANNEVIGAETEEAGPVVL